MGLIHMTECSGLMVRHVVLYLQFPVYSMSFFALLANKKIPILSKYNRIHYLKRGCKRVEFPIIQTSQIFRQFKLTSFTHGENKDKQYIECISSVLRVIALYSC